MFSIENWFPTREGKSTASDRDAGRFFEVLAVAILEIFRFLGLGDFENTGTALTFLFPVRLFFTGTNSTSCTPFLLFLDLEESISKGGITKGVSWHNKASRFYSHVSVGADVVLYSNAGVCPDQKFHWIQNSHNSLWHGIITTLDPLVGMGEAIFIAL
jgi:hypothetical protein